MIIKVISFSKRFTALLLLLSLSAKGQLVINELSQGVGSNGEYVELVVVGVPSCSSSTANLRGWIIDDNNGDFQQGAGSGIASGCIRFNTNPIWQNIKFGTIIVVYDDTQGPLSIANDIITSDGNCRLVIPFSNTTLLERTTTQPSNSNSNYPTTGFSPTGNNWGGIVGMRNTGDAFQTRKPGPTLNTAAFHSVSWGDNNSPQALIYFSGDAVGLVFSMKNLVNDNPNTQANWASDAVATNETPGVGNCPQNTAWINSMSNNCQPVSGITLTITASPAASSYCIGDTVTLTSSLNTGNVWSTGDTGNSISVVASANITLTNPGACVQPPVKVLSFGSTGAAFDADTLQGFAPLAVHFTNNSQANAVNFNWNFGDSSVFIDSVSPAHTFVNPGTYQVVLTATNGTGCSDTAVRIITVIQPPAIVDSIDIENTFEIPNVFTPNSDGMNDLFLIKSNNVETFSGLIFDRWGNKVHEWTNINEGWNGRTPSGKQVTAGVFFYVLNVTFVDGSSITPSGTITLIK